jgi:hypothetical protein
MILGEQNAQSGGGPGGRDVELERRVVTALRGISHTALVEWYASLAPSWLEVQPPMRRLLMLGIHQWIAERVLTPRSPGGPSAAEDLKPGGALVRSLVALIPPDQLDDWRGWIRPVFVELKRALHWPVEQRNEAWAHWLFLIPYAEQVSRVPGGAEHAAPRE